MIIEKIFQVLFVAIMAVGILGLPAYFYLNARRKRLVEEYDDDLDNTENTEE